MTVLRFACHMLGCICVLVMSAGCYTAGPRPAETGFGQPAQVAGGESTGLPLVDPEFRLAPNDVLGITYISQDTPEGYPLQTGDTLLVEYHQQEHLNRNVVVRPDGKVTLPYIGDVQAGNVTVAELSTRIAELYRNENIFENLTNTVSLLSFNSKLRELQQSNYNSTAGQTREVTVANDGFLDLPLNIRVMAAGRSLRHVADEIRAAYDQKLAAVEVNLELRAIRSSFIYVLGEVNAPGLTAIAGPTGVAQAIAAAGGYRNTGDLSSVIVLRSDPECNAPIGRMIDVDKILSTGNMSQDVMVRRFDVVYVPPSKIKKLNDAVLMYIRNMMPLETTSNISMGFNYMWGDTTGSTFAPF